MQSKDKLACVFRSSQHMVLELGRPARFPRGNLRGQDRSRSACGEWRVGKEESTTRPEKPNAGENHSPQKRIIGALGADRGRIAVPRINDHVIGQRQQLAANRLNYLRERTARQIRSADAP
jgi:hypothetical protein